MTTCPLSVAAPAPTRPVGPVIASDDQPRPFQSHVSARSLAAALVATPPQRTTSLPVAAPAEPTRARGRGGASSVPAEPLHAHVSPRTPVTEVDVVPPKTRNRPPSTAPGASARAGGPAAPAVQVAPFHSHVSD